MPCAIKISACLKLSFDRRGVCGRRIVLLRTSPIAVRTEVRQSEAVGRRARFADPRERGSPATADHTPVLHSIAPAKEDHAPRITFHVSKQFKGIQRNSKQETNPNPMTTQPQILPFETEPPAPLTRESSDASPAPKSGEGGLDEFAKHSNARLLWETAQGRVTWGYDMAVWSAHDGEDTLFNEFAREARSSLSASGGKGRGEAVFPPASSSLAAPKSDEGGSSSSACSRMPSPEDSRRLAARNRGTFWYQTLPLNPPSIRSNKMLNAIAPKAKQK